MATTLTSPTTSTSSSSSSEVVELQVFSPKCILIRNALSMEEQIDIVTHIKDRDRSQFYLSFANNPKAQAMAQIRKAQGRGGGNAGTDTKNPYNDRQQAQQGGTSSSSASSSSSNKQFRFVFENNNPYINLDTTKDDGSIFNVVVKRLNQVLRSQQQQQQQQQQGDSNNSNIVLDVPPIPPNGRVEVGVQGYEYPNGSLGRHTDRDESLVYLISLGCPARFIVRTPEMSEDVEFDFQSGDVLYFDASPQAHVEHGVVGVTSPESSPTELVAAYDYLATHRLGVQYRLYPSLA